MRESTSPLLLLLKVSSSFVFYSCEKSIDKSADINEISLVIKTELLFE
jgi:hypothetical protein